ncbi:LytR/AlgR family response regulator transcription factor [Spirosoma agri]|uniref:Response regulator transcription factor n=1 Tax=Spirosoma agri TaxID=1987381 RepID=A0A6M0IRX4_9BACT|nr:LytTR family DNA-binding domain-containing protein [Spirosoma agri]NEU70762.1 response regulator transcription factor [Spirosoma agri]
MSSSLRCAIVEDEPLAQQLLQKYIRRISSLELVATFDDAVVAFEQLSTIRPDLICLDINMPEMTGLELLRAYAAPRPAFVLTTADPNHALEGFDLGVTDYLLKPITFDRFLKAIDRVQEKVAGQRNELIPTAYPPTSTNTLAQAILVGPMAEFIYLKTDKKLEQIQVDEIVLVEALGDYLKVFRLDRYVVTHLTMTKLADRLPADCFLRINRSYLVQLRHIKTLDGNSVILSTGCTLTIGPNYRDMVKDRIRQWLVH